MFYLTTLKSNYYHFILWSCGQTQAMASSFMRFLEHEQRTTVVRTPLDEWSARRRDLYLTTHKAHKERHKCTRWDLNQESQHANGHPHLWPRGHWHRPVASIVSINSVPAFANADGVKDQGQMWSNNSKLAWRDSKRDFKAHWVFGLILKSRISCKLEWYTHTVRCCVSISQ